MYKGSKMTNGSVNLIHKSVEKEVNGLARGLNGLANGDREVKTLGFDLGPIP